MDKNLPVPTSPNKSVIVRHDLSSAKSFLLERIIKSEPATKNFLKDRPNQYMHPYQQQQFMLQQQQEELERQQRMLTGLLSYYACHYGANSLNIETQGHCKKASEIT